MTQDEILSAAKEAGLRTGGNGYYAVCHQTDLEAFAKIIERKTIERCAGTVERLISGDGICADDGVWIHDCAAAIRKLGEE